MNDTGNSQIYITEPEFKVLEKRPLLSQDFYESLVEELGGFNPTQALMGQGAYEGGKMKDGANYTVDLGFGSPVKFIFRTEHYRNNCYSSLATYAKESLRGFGPTSRLNFETEDINNLASIFGVENTLDCTVAYLSLAANNFLKPLLNNLADSPEDVEPAEAIFLQATARFIVYQRLFFACELAELRKHFGTETINNALYKDICTEKLGGRASLFGRIYFPNSEADIDFYEEPFKEAFKVNLSSQMFLYALRKEIENSQAGGKLVAKFIVDCYVKMAYDRRNIIGLVPFGYRGSLNESQDLAYYLQILFGLTTPFAGLVQQPKSKNFDDVIATVSEYVQVDNEGNVTICEV